MAFFNYVSEFVKNYSHTLLGNELKNDLKNVNKIKFSFLSQYNETFELDNSNLICPAGYFIINDNGDFKSDIIIERHFEDKETVSVTSLDKLYSNDEESFEDFVLGNFVGRILIHILNQPHHIYRKTIWRGLDGKYCKIEILDGENLLAIIEFRY